jgi:hypothetical protein
VGCGGGLLGAGAIGVLWAWALCGVSSLHGSRWPGAAAWWAARRQGSLSVGGLVAGGLRLLFFCVGGGVRSQAIIGFATIGFVS